MNQTTSLTRTARAAVLISLLFFAFAAAQAQTTAFSYQGKLTDASAAANGQYDFQFALYDAQTDGTQIGTTQSVVGVPVTNGVFTVTLDFGAAAFASGAERFLEINVKKTSETNYATLSPRQRITSAPYAIQSRNATNAVNAEQLNNIAASNYLQTNGSGANLTDLNASSITSGTLNDAQLSANVALRNSANTFTGNQTIVGDLTQTGAATSLNLTNGFVASGALSTGLIPATGAGVRMMFYPNKAAFRAGRVDGTQWDDANIGFLSTALGNNTVASNRAAFAAGEGTTASGENSTALGRFTTASGYLSTALGNFTTASGGFSTALGTNAEASGNFSTALGYLTTASGNSSTALGVQTTASGDYSTALGDNTTASGDFSTAMGVLASTNGKTGSFVYGDASTLPTGGSTITSSANNQFVVRAQNIWLGTNNAVTNTAGRFLETSTGAYLSSSGVWTNNSSVKLKTNFSTVDSRSILRKVLSIPIQTWNYKADSPSVRHIGVMAQDFYKTFKVGADDEHITAVDTAGVTMAAIQGLNEKLEEELKAKDAKIEQLEAAQKQIEARLKRIDEQQKQIDALKTLVCGQNPNAAVCQ